ncbi:hypothetical protein COV20_03465 [Candidatus Woesearchaeota archaeon CG10_big_fil_rev_8_21_14_0_10_45_16]|nr:MAG: hypothetical protein COV20_03465 [Candidatus Woesearchaeota archaeon CG10_big_fil_rev_8_21_14_0_10_45_16]
MQYKHTQIGYLMIVITAILLVFYTSLLIVVGSDPVILAIMLFIIFIVASFSTLTVSIDQKYLKIRFGYGLAGKQFLLKDIHSVKTVRNHWYYGWGIRVWFWPTMWIYNISGFDAIEMVMKDGRRYRIGTDQPKELEQAVLKAIRKQ